ncbi:MAG: glycosyltransferase family 2 protein [Leptolyngbyaceae cyanobacterium bins.302]|nr:glycosyltransferase family 2 protein [Leptolyngbyaceae cyanobacterium bins.302]
MKEPVFIVTPVYNRKPTTLTFLAHLQQTGDLQRYQMVVVDDGSTDGTAEAIRQSYPDVIVLSGNGDLWWTAAIAMGMQYAAQHGAEFFIWLNDDCLPEADTLPKLVEFMTQHPGAIAAPTCYVFDNGNSVAQHNGSQGRRGCAAQPGEILEVDGMSGWCVGIPGCVVQVIGVPDAYRFPHYSGDDTYIFRAYRSGFKAYLVGDLKANLIGPVHERLGIQKFFAPGRSAAKTFQSLFLSKKSPYRLPTKFFHCIERYGVWLGTCLFVVKIMSWFSQWTRFQMIAYFKPNGLN